MSEPTTFADDISQSRRLATLRVLHENEGSANDSVLRAALRQLGFRGLLQSDEAIAGDRAFLLAAELAELEVYREKVTSLVITKKGLAFLRRHIPPIAGIEYPDIA